MSLSSDTPLPTHRRIHHVGIAVRNIEEARKRYEVLSLTVTQEEVIPQEKVKVAFLQLGENLLELLQPTEKDSHINRFLERHGEGMHHLALEVQEIEAAMQEMKDKGVRLTSDVIRIGAGGHRYFFIHPSSTGGVLIEIVEVAGNHHA